MKYASLAVVFLFALSLSVVATDYKVDTAYPNLGFDSSDVVYDVFVHPDGKYLVAGEDFGSGGQSLPFLKRYNADGTLDTSFASPLLTTGSSSQNYVTHILKLLPNGQYLVRGRFNVASTFGYWARLNANGSFDTAIPVATINAHLSGVQDDGKLLFCGPITDNGITYETLYRRNSNLSFDPTFRVTFADAGTCAESYPLPSGKILVTGPFLSGGQPVKRLQRLNSDGTVDPSFDTALAPGAGIRLLGVLPNGKIMVTSGGSTTSMKLLSADGVQEINSPNCASTIGIPLEDGGFMLNGCKKWVGGTRTFDFLKVDANGNVDQSMDWVSISGFEGVKGFRADGNGGFFIYGGISIVNGVTRRGFLRVVPYIPPYRARYDFDGDGKADLAVFRPTNGTWYLNQSTAGFKYRQWGLATDRISVADADLDQKADIGVFRDGAWHALTSNDAHLYMCLGAPGDQPLVGYNNEYFLQRDMLAVRGLRSGATQWFVRSNYNNCWVNNQQPSPSIFIDEVLSDKAVVGDFNGDSIDEIGYFRNGGWYGQDFGKIAAPVSFQWGAAGDIPVPGDYDGDRQTDYAVYRPSTGQWWINRSSLGPIAITFGNSSDIPVPADYDGDGKIDVAIFRNGQWWQYLSASESVRVDQWGTAGDLPVPAQNQQ